MIPVLRRRYARADVYTAGTEANVFALGEHGFGTLICFEAIYPGLARELVRRGATFLVNISNDDWFGQRPALAQHLHAALFRAVEHRRFLVRATNTGLTAVIDPRGAVVASLPAAQAAALVATVTSQRLLTPYARWGDVFAWLCVGLTITQLWTSRRFGGFGRSPVPVADRRD
jgi:apolipoprotein N-acyltransferase